MSVISGDNVLSCSSRLIMCRTLTIFCCPLPAGAFSQSGSAIRRSLSSTACRASSRSKPTLAFARLMSARSSDWRRQPVIPRELVAAMQPMVHRQCAGEATRGTISRSASSPSTHLALLCFGIRSSSTLATPPAPL
eukprot:2781645-Prymnesium_polylepis.2